MQALYVVIVFLAGYFILGEFLLGYLCGLGCNHTYPWEHKDG